MTSLLLVTCPHCTQMIEIVEVNCAIFRCGIEKATGQQISPHLQKEECDRLVIQELIYGCGKPFRIQMESDGYKAVICEYV